MSEIVLTLNEKEAEELNEFLNNVDFDEIELPSLKWVKERLNLIVSMESVRKMQIPR